MGVRGEDRTMKSSNSLRGQMGLRSGPLAPTSAKLTTQYLVLDHMTNHYSKINKAKPAIDNKPPRSMSTSQKARDRKTRDYVSKTGHRPMSATRSRPHTTTGYYNDDIYDEAQWGEVDPEDEEEMMIHNIMRTTLRGNEGAQTNDPYGADTNQMNDGMNSYARVTRQRPSSARSHRSMGSVASRSMVQVPAKKGTYDGDLLEKRSHVFTEEKPFTPRTLKTDRKSRLSQYKYYNKLPPKDGKPAGKQQTQQEPEQTQLKKTVESTSESRPQPKPRQPRLDRTREGPVTMNSLMFETLQSRDFSKFDGNDQNSDIPKLDISMDTDHLKWIKEQASKGKTRSYNDTMKSTIREQDPCDTSVDFGKTGEMSLTYGTLGSTKSRPTLGSSKKMAPEDEEALYVKFMKDVTNEILERGVYNDRSVRLIFKSHIEQNRGHLDELRMRQITDDIRKELDIPRYDLDDEASLSMTKTNYSYHMNGTDASLDKYMSPDYKPSLIRGRDTLDVGNETTGTLGGSMQSRMSRESTEQSADSYPFKSTEEDELYSTIRSDMNNTNNLSDTLALKTYQASINEQDEHEEGEIDLNENGNSEHHGTVKVTEDDETDKNDDDDNDDDDGDDYDDDDYEDDGDDEEDDGNHTTEPTATYRTDDDDF